MFDLVIVALLGVGQQDQGQFDMDWIVKQAQYGKETISISHHVAVNTPPVVTQSL